MVMDAARLADLEREGSADLVEVFSSIQGEGLRVGERHLFVRFAHCDLHCAYCDTPLCHSVPRDARVEDPPGSRSFRSRPNPIPGAELGALVDVALRSAAHAAVSFTGGEPLLHPWVIHALAPAIRARGAAVLLETDGTLPEAWIPLRGSVDVLSLDWKLPSATGERSFAVEHRRFLETSEGKETWVKAVYVAGTPATEIREAAEAVAELRPDAVLILQPCTPFRNVKAAPPAAQALEFHAVASAAHRRVRVLPQVHRCLGQI